MDILITEESRDKQNLVGHNEAYEQVVVRNQVGLMGKIVRVKISDTKKHCLIGELVKTSFSQQTTSGLRSLWNLQTFSMCLLTFALLIRICSEFWH